MTKNSDVEPKLEKQLPGDRLEGCLLGCAIGDAIGLPYEGLSPRRIAKLLTKKLSHRFLFGHGMVSDDTDHSVFVAQALGRHPDDPQAFARCLSWKLRLWLLCAPAGIGFATLRSILKLWLGFSPPTSGVFSAGNGAAMRSAIIGVFHHENPALRRAFVTASTKITHSDPKADYGAQAVAEIAALSTSNGLDRPSIDLLQSTLSAVSSEPHWQEIVAITISACQSESIADTLSKDGARLGVSGYIYHTLPVAITAWYIYYGDFRSMAHCIISLGGDTDTVAAIAGAIAGAGTGQKGIPNDWINGIIDIPHSPKYIRRLCASLDARDSNTFRFSPMLFPRGLVFTTIVLCHAFRQILPPY